VFIFLKSISEQAERVACMKFLKIKEMAKVCRVHHRTVQRFCSEAFNFPSGNGAFVSPRKMYKRIHDVMDMNDFDKGVLHQTVHELCDKGEYPTASK
jgi:hypothetical protein